MSSAVLEELESKLKIFTRKNPKLKHFLLDSFNDHKRRYKTDLGLIKRFCKTGKVLDLGANPFHLTYCLKNLGYEVIGVDIDPGPFKKFIQDNGLNIKKVNIEREKLPFKTNSFDLVIFNEVFEHLRINPIFTLKEINRILKPKGILLLTTPNLYAIHKIVMFNLGKGFNNPYNEFNKLNTYGYMGHIREYSAKEVEEFLKQTHFKIKNLFFRNDYSFFNNPALKSTPLKLGGLAIDLLMKVNPYWKRHFAFIATK